MPLTKLSKKDVAFLMRKGSRPWPPALKREIFTAPFYTNAPKIFYVNIPWWKRILILAAPTCTLYHHDIRWRMYTFKPWPRWRIPEDKIEFCKWSARK